MTETGPPTHRRMVVLALVAGLIAAGHVGKLPPALPSISGRWESALWVMVGANMLITALAFLLRLQEKIIAARGVVTRS